MLGSFDNVYIFDILKLTKKWMLKRSIGHHGKRVSLLKLFLSRHQFLCDS